MWGLLKVAAHREQYLFGSFGSNSVLADDVETCGSSRSVLPFWADLLTVSSTAKSSVCLSTTTVRHISGEKVGLFFFFPKIQLSNFMKTHTKGLETLFTSVFCMDFPFIVRRCHNVGTEHHVAQPAEAVFICCHGPLLKQIRYLLIPSSE